MGQSEKKVDLLKSYFFVLVIKVSERPCSSLPLNPTGEQVGIWGTSEALFKVLLRLYFYFKRRKWGGGVGGELRA